MAISADKVHPATPQIGNPVRARRIEGPGCPSPAGTLVPRIDRARCEGKAACVAVCPTGVFAIGTLPREERRGLGLVGQIKGIAHRWQQALLINAGACEACGACVAACPEHAIRLVAVTDSGRDGV